MRSRVYERHGFTLIELLVVIAIIAILASILFPVFSSARAKGRQAACISNVKQIVLAIHMYGQDYDEMFPMTTKVPGSLPGFCGYYTGPSGAWQWYDAIYEYTRNRQIYICPELKTVIPGYGMNGTMSAMSVGSMWDAAKKVLIIDFADPQSLGQPHLQCEVNATGQMVDDTLLDNKYAHRHNGGYVVGYGDGHAKHAKPDQLRATIYWDPGEEG